MLCTYLPDDKLHTGCCGW